MNWWSLIPFTSFVEKKVVCFWKPSVPQHSSRSVNIPQQLRRSFCLLSKVGYKSRVYKFSVFPSVHFISSRNLFLCTDFANCAKLSGTQARSRKQQSCVKDELLVSIEGKGLNRDKLSCIHFGGYVAQEAEAVIIISTLEAEYSNWRARPQNWEESSRWWQRARDAWEGGQARILLDGRAYRGECSFFLGRFRTAAWELCLSAHRSTSL